MKGIDYATEKKVHENLLATYTIHLEGYPTTIDQDHEILRTQELTQNQKNAVDFRLGEKVICKFFIDTSNYALNLMKMKRVDAQKMINKLPVAIESMRSYLINILLPLIAAEND